MESLEERCLWSVFWVTTAEDHGPGSLRQAILDANANPGLNSIVFHIGDYGRQTIRVTSALPAVTDPVRIDGTTQPGYAGSPLIELSGADAGANADGLTLRAGNSTVRGLVINRFSGSGIVLQALGGDRLVGNFIGTDGTGTRAMGNGGVGVLIVNGAATNTIGGVAAADRNLIAANLNGILLTGSGTTGNIVQGNLIGTDVTGTASLGNTIYGVILSQGATGNLLGGTGAGAGNIISGNLSGVGILGSGTTDNRVQGNRIGTDVTGTKAIGNGGTGVILAGAAGNRIGGTAAGAPNLISANVVAGVFLTGEGTANNQVLGNFIGTDITGTQPLGNGQFGIVLTDGAANNSIGGTATGAGNLVSANHIRGVALDDEETSGNVVQGNYIGTDATGTKALGNASEGVLIQYEASNNTIGGTMPGARNVIAANNEGVVLDDEGTSGNVVQGNYIGTDVTGRQPLGNRDWGVIVLGPASYNTIGGTMAGAGNLIAANTKGVALDGSGATGNAVEGNQIGTDLAIGRALVNGGPGVLLFDGAIGNTIGGTVPAAGNLIVASGDGVARIASGTADNEVQGNLLTTDLVVAAAWTNGTPNQRWVIQVYLDLLRRPPEPAGLANWTDQLNSGTTASQVVAGIMGSPEYDDLVVQELYQALLHRPADPLGLKASVAALMAGVSVAQLESIIVSSPEYFQTRAEGQLLEFLNALYQDAFHRDLDPSGQATWGQLLTNGTSRRPICDAIFGSGEYWRRRAHEWYQIFLGRAPDSGGLNGLVNLLTQGANEEVILMAILGSAEYRQRVETGAGSLPHG